MRLALLLVALATIVQGIQAQTSATVQIYSSTNYGSYGMAMSTSFVGLRLPSGGGSVSITITPGDLAGNEFVTSYADHTQAGPYYYTGSSTSFNIGATGKYWVYLSANAGGTPNNYDWLEIRVEASNYGSTPTCYYCSPLSGWGTGWPPAGIPQVVDNSAPVVSVVPGSSAPVNYTRVPNWVIAVLSVVIGLAVLLPASYFVYRRVSANKNKPTTPVAETQVSTLTSTPAEPQVELQSAVQIATAV
jgi:hypothetical protein